MWPSRWFTPTRGLRWAQARALATAQPTRSEPTSPGPWVTAMPSRSLSFTPASLSARSMTGLMTSRCRREASSGTTPPHGACRASWEATTSERMRRPSANTAAAVSSHEVSMPRTIMSYQGLKAREGRRLVAAAPRQPLAPLPGAGPWPARLRPLDFHRLEHLERLLELHVLLEVLHRVERGRLGLLAGRLLGELDDDVRRDALAVDGAALGREVLGRGQAEARAVRERDDRLDRALTERLGAHQHGAVVILQRAGHDLRRGGAALVDQDDHGNRAQRLLGVRREAHVLVAHPAFGVDDQLAVLQELLRDLHRRGEKTARIVAEVQDQRLHPVLAELVQRAVHVVGRLLLELAEPQIRHAVTQVMRPNGLHADLLAGDLEILRLRPAFPHHGDHDLGGRPAPHLLDGVGQLHVLGDEAVDLHDAVARLQACPMGRGPFDGRHHGEHVVPQRDLDAEAAEAARRLHLHLAIALGVEERGVRIE